MNDGCSGCFCKNVQETPPGSSVSVRQLSSGQCLAETFTFCSAAESDERCIFIQAPAGGNVAFNHFSH